MIISDCVNSFGLISSVCVHSFELIISYFVHSFELIISYFVHSFELISVNSVPFVGFFLPVPSGLLFPRQIFPAPAGQRRFFLTASGQTRFLLPSLRRGGYSPSSTWAGKPTPHKPTPNFLTLFGSPGTPGEIIRFASANSCAGAPGFVKPPFSSHDVDSQNLRLPLTPGARF